jgi:uncharacterized protein (TIGR00255 family)
MIKSMTGYGKAEGEFQSKKIIVELKSLNSKQLDLNVKLPFVYKEKELDLRNEINRELGRGKIEISVSLDAVNGDSQACFNTALLKLYYKQIVDVSKELNIPISDDIMSTLLRLPDVYKTEKMEISEEEWSVLLSCTNQAIKLLNDFRVQEGSALEKDITERVQLTIQLANSLGPYEERRLAKLKQKIRQGLSEIIATEKVDENRFEQELIYYIEKLDITEEKVRLANHCSYFLETMADTESSGKKLSFIAQEIGREINTIGSKANDADMQKIVVRMKDELEKIKEQLNNIL